MIIANNTTSTTNTKTKTIDNSGSAVTALDRNSRKEHQNRDAKTSIDYNSSNNNVNTFTNDVLLTDKMEYL